MYHVAISDVVYIGCDDNEYQDPLPDHRSSPHAVAAVAEREDAPHQPIRNVRHSDLNAVVGSTRVARHAGM